MTKDELLEAIRDFFSDTSRPREETAQGLDEVSELATELFNAIQEELYG